MSDLPEPLVPAEVDLRGYEFMPYYGDRLRDSDLNSRATDAEYRAAHNLWWAAWKQVPAASVPDDDTNLCRLADLGRDLKTWRTVKDRAMHGFVLCSDGRWYHRVLAPLAIEAWHMRQAHQTRTLKARIAALEKRLKAATTEEEQRHVTVLITTLKQTLSQTECESVTGRSPGQSQTLSTSSTGQDRTGYLKKDLDLPKSETGGDPPSDKVKGDDSGRSNPARRAVDLAREAFERRKKTAA